ncbi:hypothetical protein CVT25_007420 [Psilocybe cyanescens]|uniref:Uncharacterized protein n=1 Tax=Psilocybe cyanescens TaxID=93625 RepID=A0A409X244_PSICY|nr:hypothetical protein CVT25_007420 [Psilocybe cyanescens]
MCCCIATDTLPQDPNTLEQLNNALALKYKTNPITNIEQLESTLHGLAKGLFKEAHGYAWDGANTIPSDIGTDARWRITNIEQLESTLHGLAKGLFKEAHGYAWDGANTIPSDIGTDARLKALNSFDDIHIHEAGDNSDTLKHILGDGKAPEWFRAKAELDIGAQAIKIFNNAKHGQWDEATFSASYDGPDPGQGPVEVRIAFLYANTTLVENGEKDTHTILYYLAIYHGPKASGI